MLKSTNAVVDPSPVAETLDIVGVEPDVANATKVQNKNLSSNSETNQDQISKNKK